jgi:hypothetical protein
MTILRYVVAQLDQLEMMLIPQKKLERMLKKFKSWTKL